MTHSAIYEGAVSHRRLGARPHAFRQRLFMLYLDLDELPRLFERRWLWSARRPNVAWFRRADYMGPVDRPLREVVLDRAERALGRRPSGAVRMLTHVRTLGYVFNPVTFYYCFDEGGELACVVAEITNTPWRERHAYVVPAHGGRAGARFAKQFHVSPFLGMEQDYAWNLPAPGERLDVHMTNTERGEAVFHAALEMERRPITGRSLAGVLLRYPLLTARVHLAIYWQAARLWWKRVPFHVHPKKRAPRAEKSAA